MRRLGLVDQQQGVGALVSDDAVLVPGSLSSQLVRWQESSPVVDDSLLQEAGNSVEQSGAANTLRPPGANDGIADPVTELHVVDSADRSPHAATDLRSLECRAGGGGAGDQPVSDPSTISPFVPMSIASLRRSLQSRSVARITPTVSAPTKPAMLGSMQTLPAALMAIPTANTGTVRGPAITGTYGDRARYFGLIPRNRWCMVVFPTDGNNVDLLPGHSSLFHCLADQQVELLDDGVPQCFQTVFLLGRKGVPGDHVGAVPGLRVERRNHRQFLSGTEVHQVADHGRSPDVKGDSQHVRCGVDPGEAGQRHSVSHRSETEICLAEQLRQVPDLRQGRRRILCQHSLPGEGILQALPVGALVFQGRGIQFDEGFVKVRVGLDVPFQPGDQNLMLRCFRKRDVDRDVLADLRDAGQAEALRQVFGFQVFLLDAGGRAAPL